MLRHYSKIQPTIALSSGEAELYACNRCAAEALGLKNIAKDFGAKRGVQIHIDSAAAKAIVMRRGTGRVKHLETQQLWLQQRVAQSDLDILKVAREDNTSDVLTHYWSPKDGHPHLERMNLVSAD